MYFGQELNVSPGLSVNPTYDITSIIPPNQQDTDSLIQLGELGGLVNSIKSILNNQLSNAGDIPQKYARELVLKLSAISQYRWDSGLDPNSHPKMLIPGQDSNMYISESPLSIINKARQFVAMYNMPKKPTEAVFDKMSESQQNYLRRIYGENNVTVSGGSIADYEPRVPLNGGYEMADMRNVW